MLRAEHNIAAVFIYTFPTSHYLILIYKIIVFHN